MEKSSEVPGFFKRTIAERRAFVREWAGLTEEEVRAFEFPPGIDPNSVDRMIENVIGVMPLPLGVATNFRINGLDYLIPMAIEEPSVVAAASNAAKVARAAGGFTAQTTAPVMIGQVQILDVPDPAAARLRILHQRDALLEAANAKDPVLVKFGGGAKDLEVRIVPSTRGTMVVAHLLVDARDAGGMNAVNTMCEALAPEFARLTGGRVVLRIISNLAIHRLASRPCRLPRGASQDGDRERSRGRRRDPGRVRVRARRPVPLRDPQQGDHERRLRGRGGDGNDSRAIESGAHTYAAWKAADDRSVVRPLTTYEKDKDGNLVGTIEIPGRSGSSGAQAAVHPTAKANVKLLGVKSARELGEVLASVGLAQNFAALRALATEGSNAVTWSSTPGTSR